MGSNEPAILQPVRVENVPGWELGAKSKPALIVIQEWFGVTDDIKSIATQFHKKKGWRVFIPDIYDGRVGLEVAEAKHLMEELDWLKARDQVVAMAKYLRQSGSPRVGCTGYCMGGGLTIGAAEAGAIDAGVPCYGLPNDDRLDPGNIRVPLQGHYGKHDTFFPPEKVHAFVDKVKAGGGDFECFIYEDAGHAFLNPEEAQAMTGQVHPSKETVELAWKRTYDFLSKHLET